MGESLQNGFHAHRAQADRASPSVDYGVLVLKQHLGIPLLVVRTGLYIKTQR